MRKFGAVFVRINNPVLLRIMNEYMGVCPDVRCFLESQEYDLEYGDSFYQPSLGKCPETLDDLEEYILELIEECADDSFDEFAIGFRKEYEEIKRGFTYVQWIYTPPADHHEMLKDFVFTYGEDKTHNDDPQTTLKVRFLYDAHGGMMAEGFSMDLLEYFEDAFGERPGFSTWYKDYRYRDNSEKIVDINDEGFDLVDIDICYRFRKPVTISSINKVASKLRHHFDYRFTCEC